MTRIPPRFKHQNLTLSHYAAQPAVYDLSDPGTGKTRAALDAWAARHKKDGKALLVLCPKTLCETAWLSDAERFLPGVRVSVAYAENRQQAFEIPADIYITNLDASKWLAQQPKKFFAKFGSLVIDEITAYKNGGRAGAARSKAAAQIVQYFEHRAGLTGTPNPNSVTEMWHQVLLLDDGQRLGKKFYPFRSAVCTPEIIPGVKHGIKWVDKDGAEEAVFGLINDMVIRHRFEDCIDIPSLHQYQVAFHMNKKHKKIYQDFAKDALIELREGTVTGVNAAVLRNKLLQIASGAVYGDPSNPDSDYLLLDQARYELVLDLVEQRASTLVFFNWAHQKTELLAEATKRKISAAVLDGSTPLKQRAQLVQDFQAGRYQVLFLHWQTGAHGLTLTQAASVIACSPIYQADFLKQAIHRIRRAGQTQKQEAILIAARDTVESEVYLKLMNKTERMNNFLGLMECA